MQLILWLLVAVSATLASRGLETVYEWRYIDYLWDSNNQKERYIRNGDYNYKKIVPIDVDKANDGRIFITAIRNEGVPASLATVTNHFGPSGPLLRPYPNWSWYNKNDCDGITNVYRVIMDECNKMYVLDNGYIGDNYTCQAQILIFDLGNDRLINRIKIPDNIAQNATGAGKLVTPVIEVEGPNCALQNMFMADVAGQGLVMWNGHQLIRLEAKAFDIEESHTEVEIAGESFKLADSLMGLAVTSSLRSSSSRSSFTIPHRELVFRPFSSRALYAADTRTLTCIGDGTCQPPVLQYRGARDMLPSQATAMAAAERGTLFFGLTREIAIGCWNRERDMSKNNVVIAVKDEERLQFASGLKVLSSSRTNGLEEVWILTNRLQKVMTGSQNFNEVNFRVLKSTVDDLVRGTKCEAQNV